MDAFKCDQCGNFFPRNPYLSTYKVEKTGLRSMREQGEREFCSAPCLVYWAENEARN